MTTRYRVRLGNSYLDKQDNNIAILNIEYSGLESSSSQQSVANLGGFDEVNQRDERQTVTVTFEIHIYDVAKRNAICQAVNAWAAQGGELRTNDRAGQFLRVKCEQYAAINARDWTAPLTLVFTTTHDPYWRSDSQNSKTIKGKTTKSTLAIGGNIGNALVSAKVTSTKGTVKSIQLNAGDTSISLTGLNVALNEFVQIDYVNYRYMRIRHYTSAGKLKNSLISNLKATSSDNLMIPCGATSEVSINTSNNVTAVFTVRGCWR